jgi:hypothetical protein
MDNKEALKKIDRNRELIAKALEIEDIELMYFIVRRLAKENEKLIAKLKK